MFFQLDRAGEQPVVGLDISVTLVPVSPRDPFTYFELVRKNNDRSRVVYEHAECEERVEGCLGSMRVSADRALIAQEAELEIRALDGGPFDERIDGTAEDRSFVAGHRDTIPLLLDLTRATFP